MAEHKPQKIVSKPHGNNYWEQLIANFSSHSKMWLEDFETEKTHPAHKYFHKKIVINKEIKTSIRKFCVQEKISLFTFINSAWALLLNRYATTDDIIYATGEFISDPELSVIHGFSPLRS